MRKLYDRFVAVMLFLSGSLCVVMLALVLVGLFYRYVVDEALSWYDEFAGFTLVWLTMVGSVAGLAKGKHISFETLVEKLPRRVQYVLEIVVDLCVLSFSLVLVVYGWELIREMGDETAVSVPSVRMAWVYAIMPVCGALMALIGVVDLVTTVQRLTRPSTDTAPRPQSMQEAQ